MTPTKAYARERAADVIDAVAAKLADPEHVAAVTDAPSNEMDLLFGRRSPWSPAALSDGHPGVSLLFAELGAEDRTQRPRTHAHLTATLAAPAPPPQPQLYSGLVSLAFAAHAAALAFGGYETLLARLDDGIVAPVRARARADRDRIAAGRPIGSWDGYDIISGAAGIGRHLLARSARGADVDETLTDLLSTVVTLSLADDVMVEATNVPAWWVHHNANAEPTRTSGHLNLGLAHGVGGPLAFLALAWQAGIRVDRQDEAIERIVTFLEGWRFFDEAGPGWPYSLSAAEMHDPDHQPQRFRDVWCYGAAGLGRAIFLAGTALGRPGWKAEGHAALQAALVTAADGAIHDFALCHGWAGLLQISLRMAWDTKDPSYDAAADALASRITEGFDAALPFGFRYTHPAMTRDVDRPGFLEGAAGIALALHSYVTGAPSATNWDAALLLS